MGLDNALAKRVTRESGLPVQHSIKKRLKSLQTVLRLLVSRLGKTS